MQLKECSMKTADFKAACESLGFPTRQATAEALGITRQHVWKLASGQLGVSRPTALLLAALLRIKELSK